MLKLFTSLEMSKGLIVSFEEDFKNREWTIEQFFQAEYKSMDLLRDDIQDKTEIMLSKTVVDMTILVFLKDTENKLHIGDKLRSSHLMHYFVVILIQIGLLYVIIKAIFFPSSSVDQWRYEIFACYSF